VIRLLLADDQNLVRTALATMLDLEEDFEVVAQASRGDEVVATALRTQPDIALLDLEMPGMDGLAAAAALNHELPECRLIILTAFGRPGFLRRAMEAGASGFVVKDAPAEQLADAVRRVARGERVVDPALAAATLAGGASPLTGRRCDGRRHLRQAVPHRGDGAQLPVCRDREDRRAQPRRGGAGGRRARLALTIPG
jgi:two-component system response regulator DesR